VALPDDAAPGLAVAPVEGTAADAPALAPLRSAPLAPGITPPPEPPPLPPLAPEEVWQHLPVTRDVLEPGPVYLSAADGRHSAARSLFGLVPVAPTHPGIPSPLRVDYTFDPELERRVFDILERSHVRLGHVIVLDPDTGRILAYASTDVEDFPPNRVYPAASLIKVVTAAAALHYSRAQAEAPCRFLGSPYILTPQRIDPPRRGKQISLEDALATSNNQCFAQLAVHAVGAEGMVDAIRRFGLLRAPAPGHPPGMIDPGTDRFDLGRLGCGLWGTWITPLHAAELAATLARGRQVEPYWIERVTDASGRRLRLAERRPPREVLTPALAAELRGMLVETTISGTARRGFHTARGASLLGPVQAAGKTGSLSGTDPVGRYEWFAGVAPADDPKVAIAVVVVNQQRYWAHASRVAGQVLQAIFCPDGRCTADAAERWTRRNTGGRSTMVGGDASSPQARLEPSVVVSEAP
jgi:membrane peptidoglycan carboxypeptidase